jgi:HK97 family phage portal protein
MLFGQNAPDIYSKNRLTAYKGWVYACINAVGDNVASTQIKLQTKTKDGWKDVPEHEALVPLQKANPLQSGYELLFSTASLLELDGNAPWLVIKNESGSRPLEIWPLNPSKLTAKNDSTGLITHYELLTDNGIKRLETDEVIPHKTFNPQSLYRGIGTVAAAAVAIDTDEFAATWNKNFFYNSAMPSATLETDKALTPEQHARLKAQWESKYQGLDNAHKLAILESGLKFNPISMSQKDMDFLESRRFSRDEILALFRVPKVILGIVEDVNRANAEASEYIFAKYRIRPMVRLIVEKLNEFYLPLFKGLNQDNWRFTFVDPVPDNVELDLKVKEAGLKNGYYTINEVREMEGKEPVEGGEVPYIPLNMVPITYSSEPAVSADSQQDKAVKKEFSHKGVNKRQRYLRNKIIEQKTVYKHIILSRKNEIIKRLKGDKSFTKDLNKEILAVIFREIESKWQVDFKNANESLYQDALLMAGTEAIQQVNVDISFDLKHPRALEWISKNALKKATWMVETLKEEIRGILYDGIDQGLSINDMAGSISSFFDLQADYRAERIARTETIASYAQGSLEGYRQSGVVKMKRWLTAGDDRVDPECAENEDQGAIGLEDHFKNGGDAPPVHPNCRCSLVPVVQE